MVKQVRNKVTKGAAAAGDRAGPAEDGSEHQTVGFLPADPQDPLLTLDGAVCKEDGKIDVAAYVEIAKAYASEPPPDQHPDPSRPGVRHGEFVPKGLRMWDDVAAGYIGKDGAGWIANHSSKVRGKALKWFNIRTCGSWRMAFVLARLQRELWERSAPREPASAAADAKVSAEGCTEEELWHFAHMQPLEREEGVATPPQGKRKRPPQAGEFDSARKKPVGRRPAAGATSGPTTPRKEPAPVVKPIVPAAGSKLGSVMDRLKAKLAAKSAEQPSGAPAEPAAAEAPPAGA